MKRKIYLFFFFFALSLTLTSCTVDMMKNGMVANHVHTYSNLWSSDEVSHWYAATCGHTNIKSSLASHIDEDSDGVCDVCVKPYYTPHSHTYESEWSSDGENHWHEPSCNDTEEVLDFAPHRDDGIDGVCDVCEKEYYVPHTHTYENNWSSDKENHWYKATCEHADEISGSSPHTDSDGDGICDVCDYGRPSERKIDILHTNGVTNRLSIGELQYLTAEVYIEGIYEIVWTQNITVKINGEKIENGEKIYAESKGMKTLVHIYSSNNLEIEAFVMVFNKEVLSKFATVLPDEGRVGTAATDTNIFLDRVHAFGEIPSWLIGKSYLMCNISAGANFRVTEGGWVYLLTPESGNFSKVESLEKEGFEVVYTLEPGVLASSISGRVVILGKKMEVGDIFTSTGAWTVVFADIDKDYIDIDPREGSMLAPDVIISPAEKLNEHAEYSIYLDGERKWQGMASIAKDDKSGRIFATWYSGGTGEGSENFVVLYTSADDGKTWTGPVTVVDPYMKDVRAFDPNLWTDPDGRIWLIWTQSYNHSDGRFGVWAMRTENPEEECPDWSEPVRIANGVGICDPIVLNNAIGDLPEGTWLFPAAVWDRENVMESVKDENHPNCYVSFDKGDSWSYYGSVPSTEAKRTYDENMIVENSDGTLTMYIRTDGGIEKSGSVDGKTWTPSVYAGITQTSARFWIGRLEDGVLLAVYNAVGRSHMTAAISYDDGKSWSYKLELYEPYSIYPDVHIDEDGYIYIITCENPFDNMKINMAKIRKEDIIAGKIVTEGCYLRTVINDNTK